MSIIWHSETCWPAAGTDRDTPHMREQVATFANKLQAAAKTWLGKVQPASADKVAVR